MLWLVVLGASLGLAWGALGAPAEGGHAADVGCVGDGEFTVQVYLGFSGAPAEGALESVVEVAGLTSELFRSQSGDAVAPRWATTVDCELSVVPVEVPASSWEAVWAALRPLRDADPRVNVRHLVFFDGAGPMCGFGEVPVVGDPTTGDLMGVMYRPCGWTPRVAAHELLHTLGAVNPGAPSADGGWHCLSSFGADVMCRALTSFECGMEKLDCQGDSYFNRAPAPGGWLDSNPLWNTAFSPFLASSPDGPVDPVDPVDPGPEPQPFPDINGHPHEDAIRLMWELGVVEGFPDGRFRPNEPVTRGQMAAMLQRFYEMPGR